MVQKKPVTLDEFSEIRGVGQLKLDKYGKVFVRSCAGIVADSVPEKEHQECINKAKAVMVALAEAEGGSNL